MTQGIHCKDCRFFAFPGEHFPGIKSGLCRRRAPVRTEKYEGAFPVIEESNWCGEFEAYPLPDPVPILTLEEIEAALKPPNFSAGTVE